MIDLKEKNIAVVAHTLWTGPAHDLEEFLKQNKTRNSVFIGHPIYYRKGRPGHEFRSYKYGELKKDIEYSYHALPGILQYIKDVFLTIFWLIRTKKKWDLIVALDCLNAFSALILRKLGIVNKVVYYTIDYTPKRFQNFILNDIYHWFDKTCVFKADMTWNVSPRISNGREIHRGVFLKDNPNQTTVPIGVWFDRVERKSFHNINPHTLVYMGGLVEKSGIQIVLEAIPDIVKSIPDFKFLIIGSGEYESILQQKSREACLDDIVTFTGYIESHEEVESLMSMCGVAIAPYNEDLDDWTYYADPGKIKSYLASGLPVITTSLPYNANELCTNHCGVVINYEKDEVAKAVIELMLNTKKLKRYRYNSARLGKSYNWKHVFKKALSDIFKN
jgi:glycosyltransferase involved in cell wall biosynthesis